MRLISLDTPNEVLWAEKNEIERLIRERPTPQSELSTVVRTKNGNLVEKRCA